MVAPGTNGCNKEVVGKNIDVFVGKGMEVAIGIAAGAGDTYCRVGACAYDGVMGAMGA